MRKFILPLLCLFVCATVYGDDYTTTTILNNPVGVFENLTVSGASTMSDVEIGARPKSTSLPVMQTQKLTVYGTTELLPSDGTGIQVGGSLYLLGGRQYTFSNVYVYNNSLLYLSSSLVTNEIYAKYINTFSSFTEGTDSSTESTLNLAAGTPFRAGTLKFWDGTNVKTMENPRECGSRGVWVSLEGGDSKDNYGHWSALIASGSSPSDTCNGDKVGEYTCPAAFAHGVDSNPASCLDVRSSNIATQYYSTTGGVYFTQARGRKECTYISNTDTCQMSSSYLYTAVDGGTAPTKICPFTLADITNAQSTNNLGMLCHALCGDVECTGFNSCRVDADNDFASSSGSGGQPGVASCSRTSWPANTGLECTNSWTEKSVRVLYCGAGSGKKYPQGNFFQSRTVVCGVGTTGSSPGTFLTVDYER